MNLNDNILYDMNMHVAHVVKALTSALSSRRLVGSPLPCSGNEAASFRVGGNTGFP